MQYFIVTFGEARLCHRIEVGGLSQGIEPPMSGSEGKKAWVLRGSLSRGKNGKKGLQEEIDDDIAKMRALDPKSANKFQKRMSEKDKTMQTSFMEVDKHKHELRIFLNQMKYANTYNSNSFVLRDMSAPATASLDYQPAFHPIQETETFHRGIKWNQQGWEHDTTAKTALPGSKMEQFVSFMERGNIQGIRAHLKTVNLELRHHSQEIQKVTLPDDLRAAVDAFNARSADVGYRILLPDDIATNDASPLRLAKAQKRKSASPSAKPSRSPSISSPGDRRTASPGDRGTSRAPTLASPKPAPEPASKAKAGSVLKKAVRVPTVRGSTEPDIVPKAVLPSAATIPDDAIPALPTVKGDTLPDASRVPSPEKTPKKPDEYFHDMFLVLEKYLSGTQDSTRIRTGISFVHTLSATYTELIFKDTPSPIEVSDALKEIRSNLAKPSKYSEENQKKLKDAVDQLEAAWEKLELEKTKQVPSLKPDDKENPKASPISEVQIVARFGRLISEKGEVNGRITLATELFVASRNVAHGREALQNSAVAFLTEASRMKVDIKGSISKNDRPSTAAEELAIYYEFGIPGFPIDIHKAIEWYTEAKRLAEGEKLPSEDIEKLRVSIFGLEHNLDESESKLSDAEQQKLQESVQAKAQQISMAMGKGNNGITLRNNSYGVEGFSKNWKMQRGLSRLENAYQLLSGDQKAALKTVQMELDNYYITEGQITTKGERVITLRYSQSAVEMRETIVDALEKFAKEPSKPAEKEEDKESNAKADVADEKADNEQLQRNAKAYIEQFKGKFESSTEEETRAKALGVEKVFQQWSHEYYELSYCEHNVRDFGHGYSDKLRKQLGIFEQARDAYSKAIAEKKAGPAMRFTPQDKYKTQIEQYDLRYVTPGKVIELGYGGSRYYRHEERLYYSGGQTHDVKGNLRSHQSFCDVENENNLFVLTTNKEFLRAEKEDANGSLTVYRTSRGKFFNEFGAEYKKDPNGLYKLDGKNAWDNEEYIGKVPNGLWYRFIVNEEGMGWGERITDKMTWELEYQITLSAGAHTRVLSPGKSGDRNAIAPNERDMIVGEFLRGRHTWAYDAGEEKKLQEDSQKLVSLYPIIVQVKELLYEKRNRSLATLWDDAKKLEEIRPLLPDLKQAVDLLAGEGGKKGDGTIGNPTMQKYVSIFEDYKEAKKMLDTLRKNTTLASYDTFERTYCEACFKAGMREEGLQKAHEKVKANPDVGWARKLLVEHLGTDPSATPQERTEALELARTLYAENPKDHQKILATVLEKMGKHEEAVQILLDGKEGPQKQADEKKLSGLPEQVRFFLAKYDVTEKFQEGVIKGDVKIDDDSFEKFPEGITKIEGDLEIRSTNFTSLSHDLKEVGGSCGISHSAALQNLADAGLEKVGAILSFNNCPDLRELPKNLHYARHLQAGLCIHLQMLPPNMHVEVGAYLGACTRIERIPPGFTAGYLEIPDAVKKRTKE